MQIAFYALVVASILAGVFLMVYGIYGLVKGETYLINKQAVGNKVSGKIARKYSFYYFVAGIIWFLYAIFRLLEN